MEEKNSQNGNNNDYIDFSQIFQSNYSSNGKQTEEDYKSLIQSPQNLCKLLKTDLKKGITTLNKAEMEWRIKTYGTNKLPPEKPLNILDFILECFEDPTLKVLLVSAVISLIIGLLKEGLKTGWIEGGAIFGAVFIVTAISSSLNYNEQLQFRKLKEENEKKRVLVVRNGIEMEIDDEEILVGDLLVLKLGEIISVDGIFVSSNFIITDESAINGESDLIKKTANFSSEFKNGTNNYVCPILISGTQILEGQGQMIVCAVGNRSFNGRNRELLSKDNENDSEENLTPLKKQLNDLADLIGQFGYIMAGLIGGVIILKDLFLKIIYKESIFVSSTLDTIINAFILAITVIVVAIPEGLPMAVAISLAYSLGQMKKEKNLVKNLNSSETMGNVNNICTDKTGTLTRGQMVVESFFFKGRDYNANEFNSLSSQEKKLFFENINNNMTVVETTDINGNKVLNGDMTEKALYNFMIDNGYDKSSILNKDDDREKYVLNFNSDNKFMATLIKESPYYYKLFLKGAHEKVFPLLTSIRSGSTVYEMFDKYKDEVSKIIRKYSTQSKRTLIFASKKITISEFNIACGKFKEKNVDFYKSLYKGLNFEYLIGIRDQLRPEVPNSVLQCHKAGIKVRMVTGDNIMTALAISKDSNIISEEQFNEALEDIDKYRSICNKILRPNRNYSSNNIRKASIDQTLDKISANDFDSPIALEGEQFRLLSGNLTKNYDEKTHKIKNIELNDVELFIKTTKRLRVIARATPEDKFLLVFGLKQLENIIAVTGDGTNDAPALKEAHVGFAMGIRGTDIAQQAADILLLDDSFSSIITACKFGRNVYDSIRKFVQFQLTTNIVAVFMTLLGGVILKDSPLNAIQMLWVNLIMDSFASLALATEKPNDKLLERKPYKRNASILTVFMKANIVSQGLFQIIILLFILFKGDTLFGVNSDRELEHYDWNDEHGYHFTIFFDVFVFLQVFNSINARKLNQKEINIFEGIEDNIYYLIVQGFIVFGQVVLVTFGGRAVRTQPLSIFQHICCALIASLSLGVGYLVKLIPIDMSEKVVKTKEEIDEENEEERIKKERNSKRLQRKKTKGPNLTLRRVIIPPRNRKITYNQIEINSKKCENNINKINDSNYRTSSPIVIERKNRTPIYSSRGQQNNNSTKNEKQIDDKRTNITNNIKTIYSYNFKDKTLSSNSNNISTTEDKNLYEDLLSEDTKNTEYSPNKNNKNEKEINNKNNEIKGKSIITPRFNNNTMFEGGNNENKKEEKEINKDEKIQNIEEKQEISEKSEENKNILQNENKEQIVEDIIKKDNLFDNISEESTEFKNLKNINSN